MSPSHHYGGMAKSAATVRTRRFKKKCDLLSSRIIQQHLSSIVQALGHGSMSVAGVRVALYNLDRYGRHADELFFSLLSSAPFFASLYHEHHV